MSSGPSLQTFAFRALVRQAGKILLLGLVLTLMFLSPAPVSAQDPQSDPAKQPLDGKAEPPSEIGVITLPSPANGSAQGTKSLISIQAVPGADLGEIEVESNDTPAAATTIPGSNVKIKGNLFPNGDTDYYSFTAAAGDRVYAAIIRRFRRAAAPTAS